MEKMVIGLINPIILNKRSKKVEHDNKYTN